MTHNEIRDYLAAAARQAGFGTAIEQTVNYRYVEPGGSWAGAKGRADLVVSLAGRRRWVIEVKAACPPVLWDAVEQVNKYAGVLNCRPVLVYPDAANQPWVNGVAVMSPNDAVEMFDHELIFGHREARDDVERFYGFHGVAS